MRILITGGHGMLGRTLQANWHVTHTLAVADLPEVDVTDPDSLRAAFDGFHPEVVVHCAAKTNVDACESDREGAFRLNAEGSANVARACAEHGVRLLAISTDYVFAGDRPGDRSEEDPTAPKTVYGASKLAGEEAIRALCPNHVIVRTAWLYGPGGPSFVHAILRQARANPDAPLRVVDDQRGNPTSTLALADALMAFLARPTLRGTFHVTCEGTVSWCGFAREILRLAGLGTPVLPCSSADYPRPAPRPAWSALSKAKLAACGLPPMPDWQEALAHAFAVGL